MFPAKIAMSLIFKEMCLKEAIDMQALQPKMNAVAFRILSSGVRTGNNILGGMSFVILAKVLGVQQSKGDEILEAELAEAVP